MGTILLWLGIALTVGGFIALGWQASKRLAVKDEIAKMNQKRETLQLHRNYTLLTIIVGMLVLVVAILL